jgi:hypothetical protein
LVPEATAVDEELVRLMKTWTRTFGTALTLALFTGCTVTVGNGNGDDSDDIDFSDKSEEPETTEDNEETTEKPETTAPEEETTEGSVTTSEEATSSTTEPVTSSTGGETSSSPGETTTEPIPNSCNSDPEAGSCDACAQDSCEADWEACCATEGCLETWTAIYSCVINNPSDDPWADFDDCAAGASDTGDALDLPNQVLDLTSCVNAPYMGEGEDPDWGRVEGDGTCTLPCYNVASLDQ